MGRLYIPEENQFDGPWLIGHENLETLNELFNEVDDKLKQALYKTIENTAKQQMDEDQNLDLQKKTAKLRKKYNKESKSVEVTFTDGSTYEAHDIKAIVNHINTHSTQSPEELYAKTTRGSRENEFSLIINSNAEKEEGAFEYRIRCLDEDIQQEIKTLIDKWIRENKPSRTLQLWNSAMPFWWFIGFFVVLISWSNITTTSSKSESYKTELKKEAKKIIENKNIRADQDSVLSLLLKLQTDYVPDTLRAETVVVHDKAAKKTFIFSLIIFLISLIRPNTIIGIGKKYNKLLFYRFWWKYIIFGGISLLMTTILSDSFLHFIQW